MFIAKGMSNLRNWAVQIAPNTRLKVRKIRNLHKVGPINAHQSERRRCNK